MIIKSKFALVLIAALFASFLVASNAQAAGDTITGAELKKMETLEKELTAIRELKGASAELATDPDFKAKFDEAKAYCKELGTWMANITKPNAITSNFIGTSNGANFECQFGSFSLATSSFGANKFGDGYNPDWQKNIHIHNHVTSAKNGGPALTADSVKKPADVGTSSAAAWLIKIVNIIFVTVANLFATVLAGVATLALLLLDQIVSNTTNTLQPAIIHSVWVIIRDFMNLVFIIALIMMALGTILKRGDYNYRTLLPRLIIMALLINFSEVIAKALIAFSDMLILAFKPSSGITEYGKQIWSSFTTGGSGISSFFGWNMDSIQTGIGGSITKLIGLVFLTVSLLAVAAMMLVRLVGLMFLTMISPVAYALQVLPSTRAQANKWWSTFIKYLIWGPVAMFFFRVSFVMIGQGASGIFRDVDLVLNNLFIGFFAFGGVLAAKQLGMAGSSQITGYAQKYANQGSRFMSSAYGNYFWRGNAAKHVSRFGSLGLVSKDTSEKIGAGVGKGTAWLSNKPAQIKEKYIDNPNKDREKLLATQYRKMQIKNIYKKEFDEKLVGSLKGEEVYGLAKGGKLNAEKIKAMLEHGKKDTTDALLLALHDGYIDKNKNGLSELDANAIVSAMAAAKWKAAGGKDYELTDKFVKEFKNTLKVKTTRPYLNEEIKMMEGIEKKTEEERKKIEADIVAMRESWAKSTTQYKDRKITLPNEVIRKEINSVRREAKDAEDLANAENKIVIQPTVVPPQNPPVKNRSGSDRLAPKQNTDNPNSTTPTT